MLTSSGAVAFGIVALLPVELVINIGSSAGFAMVFSLLVSAIVWNVGTWYFIGSIIGVGLANALISPDSSMAANGSGLQMVTVRNILLAWVLTLPVCIFMGAMLFAGALNVIALLGVN